MKKLTKERIKTPFLSVVPMIMVLVFTFVAIIALTVIQLAMGIDPDGEWNETVDFLFTEFGMFTGAVVAVTLVRSRNKTRFRDFIHIKNFDIMVPIMLMIFTWSVGEVCDHFSGLILSQFMTIEPNAEHSRDIIGIIGAVICAPIFEEIIFRFGGCEITKGAYSVPVICIANGIFFAAVHGYNIQGFGNVLIGGVCAAYVYCKTGNLLYTMLEHAIHNAVCFINFGDISLFGDPLYYEQNGFILGAWWWVAYNAVLVVVCLVYYFKIFRKKYSEDKFAVNKETGLPDTVPVQTVQTEIEVNTQPAEA